MQDAWRAYLEVAMGLTEASRKRATKVARNLVGKGGVTANQVQSLAEDLVSTGMANREALTKLVRYELDRALGVVGLATAEEVAVLNVRVRELEQQLQDAESPAGLPAGPGETPAKKAVAKKTVAKKTVAKKAAPVGRAQPARRAATARKTGTATKTAAKKTAATKTAARKTAARKTVAKKTAQGDA